MPELSAEETLADLTSRFRDLLIRTTEEIAGTRSVEAITSAHFESAYHNLLEAPRAREDAQRIISTALHENRKIEWIGYCMAVVLFLFGISFLGVAVFGSEEVGVRATNIVGGSLSHILLLFPFRYAVGIRRHNIGIRMLGILLDRVDDPKALSQLLKQVFREIVPEKN